MATRFFLFGLVTFGSLRLIVVLLSRSWARPRQRRQLIVARLFDALEKWRHSGEERPESN
jgi:hypothetical protein